MCDVCGCGAGPSSVVTGGPALGHAALLNLGHFAGYTDWRLPNVNELQTLVNYGGAIPRVDAAFNNNCVPGCAVLTCSCTQSLYYYWTSTSVASSGANAWVVNFYGQNGIGIVGNDGVVINVGKSNNYYARAVRGGA